VEASPEWNWEALRRCSSWEGELPEQESVLYLATGKGDDVALSYKTQRVGWGTGEKKKGLGRGNRRERVDGARTRKTKGEVCTSVGKGFGEMGAIWKISDHGTSRYAGGAL